MADKGLNFPWEAVNNRVAKIGVGSYLSISTDTDVTTAYTRLLGTFTPVSSEGFILDDDDKLKYSPADGFARIFIFIATYAVKSDIVNTSVKISLEYGDGLTLATVSGSESPIECRQADAEYGGSCMIPIMLADGDTIEIQIKADKSATITVDMCNVCLIKMY